MRKSVIKSMIAGCLAVVIISFVLMLPIFFTSMQNEEISGIMSDMENKIAHVKPLAEMTLNFNTQKMHRLFDESMKQYSYFTDSDILFFDLEGSVIWSNTEFDVENMNKVVSNVFKIMKKNGSIKSVGLLDSIYNTDTITLGEYVKNESGDNISIILYTREIPNVFTKYKSVIADIFVMELAAVVFMAAFLYVFSRNITVPVTKINKAVTEYSKGNFDSKVEYKSENEIGELVENINIMADNLKNLENMRSSFISDVSHELRTPMTSISGFVEGILDGTVEPENRDKYLKIVLSETNRLSRLVNDLLNVSRIDSGKLKIEKTEFDIIELARITLIKFEDAITERRLDVSFESDSPSCIVSADSDAMTQVLTNLIHNAVKFAADGGYIKIRIHENNNGKCLVSVTNDGQGISSDKIKFIWDRFYKTDESRSNDKTGVGLGLYIVMRIISAHDEKIYADSVPGEYTKFSFTIDMI